jgi:hypothetical protein
MNNFDYSSIQSLNLNFNGYRWNSTTHSVVVSRDLKSPNKFRIKMVPIHLEPVIENTDEANNILNKFRLNSR